MKNTRGYRARAQIPPLILVANSLVCKLKVSRYMASALKIISGDLYCAMQACVFRHDLVLELNHPFVFQFLLHEV
jgi:hypothetical protein